MMLKGTPKYDQLKEAMELIHELKIPDHLQQKALEHLLAEAIVETVPHKSSSAGSEVKPGKPTVSVVQLRQFIEEKKPQGAVEEIPCLLYWARENEGMQSANDDDIWKLYKRASSLRPPKNLKQSIRDLASKKYSRLETVKGNTGHVALSRTGEEFVTYDLPR